MGCGTKRNVIILAAVVCALSGGFATPFITPLIAQTPASTADGQSPVVPDPDRAPRARSAGELSLPHSRVYIHVGKVGLGHEHAVICELKQGTIHLGAERRAGLLVFDMQSMVADTREARKYIGLDGETSASTQDQVNANMRGNEVLNVEKFPTATFVIDSALEMPVTSVDGHSQYELVGKFTLHGVNRPLKMVAQVVEEQNGFHHVRTGFTLLQTDFGIKPFSKAFGAVGVTDELKVYGDAWVRRTPAPRQGRRQRALDSSR
ncbi:MAG: YceI family protein [Planctomycetales bacterium]|nr:YceI family protein [Planctomycetales bacterium]